MSEDTPPITGLCVVEQTCPTGYIMIDKCEDNSRAEADLWKDHLFAKKVKRFLCITRVYPLAHGTLNNVLVDLYIHDEKDAAPEGYSTLSQTQDTSEPAFKKRFLSAKLVSRSQATDAISDIVLLSKQKKAPPGYTLVGDLNGLMLCYKFGKVPSAGAPPPIPPRPQAVQQQQFNPYQNNLSQTVPLQGHPAPMYNSSAVSSTVNVAPARQQSQPRAHPLSGVPFEINPKLISSGTDQARFGAFTFKSRAAIMNEFDYPFTVEKQAQHTSSHYNGI